MTSERTKLPALASLPVAKSTVTSTSSYLNRMTPGVYITEGVIKPPEHVNDLTEQTKKKCEMAGLDLIDDIVSDMGVIKDSKGADITDKVRGQLQKSWSDTLDFTLNNQRANRVTHTRPCNEPAKNSLELITRLSDSRDTMSAIMTRNGIQLDSWSEARKTLHTEVISRYDGMVASLIHTVWGNQFAAAPAAGASPA